jgi:biotin carboxylase
MMPNKKILLLGGSAQQVIAIDKAKELGFDTVLCDYLPDNPGQYHADRFYQTSTTDKEAVLKIAENEGIDGIIAYASDPAAPTAAFVAEKLGLPTNPYESVEILCNKDRFREFLLQNGFHTPTAHGYGSIEEAKNDLNNFEFPVIIKPVDSSGSKGATVMHSPDKIEEALSLAFSFSRSKRIIIEGFIEKNHPYLIGGDIFVVDGKVVLWGLLNCHRDERVNKLVPVGKSYPLDLRDEDAMAVRETLQKMVDKLGIRQGAMNVELVVDKKGQVWPIDVGPRNGGNMIPDLLGMIFGVDVVDMSVRAAMGESINIETPSGVPYFATHNLHSDRDGIYADILFDEAIEKHIVKKCIYKKDGDTVEFFDNASKALGIVFMKFESMSEMSEMLSNVYDHITVVLR